MDRVNIKNLPARQAIKRYWRYLVGPAAFMPFAIVVTEVNRLSFDVLSFLVFVVFWAVHLPVFWLILTGRVRQSFLLVTGAATVAGAIAAFVVQAILRVLVG